MKVVIWGATGQDGFYLSELFSDLQFEVKKIGRKHQEGFLDIDITDFEQVQRFVSDYRPDYLFNFAANSTTNHSAWKENHETISTGCLNLLEAVRLTSPSTRVFLSGSGLQFQNSNRPIKETDPFEATSMYAVSRIQSVYAARYYRKLGLKIYVGYFFNHDSPFRSERHINSKIMNAARRIANGSHEKLAIGDLDARKEFGFAGDIVKAVWLMVQQDVVKEAAIGTGKSHSIEEWVNLCFSLHGLNWRDHVVTEEGFKSEYKTLVSDPSTIFSMGWKPEVTIEGLAKMMG